MSRIVWLASYPKSGNTWLRVFLANLLDDSARPVDINELEPSGMASDRDMFDTLSGVESSDMTDEEVERYRPEAYRHLAARSAGPLYIKIHDAYTCTPAGEPLVPPEATFRAIYLARNPLDVVVSFAHHFGCPLETALDRLALETMALSVGSGSLKPQLRQRLLSWSGHVSSWLDQNSIPVQLMRYEDMCLRPIEMFTSLVRFLGLPDDPCRVRRAAEFSAFEILQQQERSHGFKEKHPASPSFFRAGRADGWREVLTPAQIARVLSDHGPVMRRLGYPTGCADGSR